MSDKTLRGEKRSHGRDRLTRCGTSCWHTRNKPECEEKAEVSSHKKLDISTLARLADHAVPIMLLTLNVFA